MGERVYPRVCGGTPLTVVSLDTLMRLSPRVRGNHLAGRLEARVPRSIPACAGEPRGFSGRLDPRRVYPRVCGGTIVEARRCYGTGGLSPRVRGNLWGGIR